METFTLFITGGYDCEGTPVTDYDDIGNPIWRKIKSFDTYEAAEEYMLSDMEGSITYHIKEKPTSRDEL